MALHDSSHDSVSPKVREFTTTHWSVVLSAGNPESPQAADALERLCRTYWYPLYAYVRRDGSSPEDAQDLTQAFFARFLQKDYLADVRREKGRFRSFLLASLRHFLADERDRSRAIKRGGGRTILSLDAQDAEGRYVLEPKDELTAEKVFERRWALTVLEAARARLREDYARAGKTERFEALETFLPGEQAAGTYAQAAGRLGVAVGTVKWEVHQLKQHFRELLRAEIAHTVPSADEIDEEVRHLITVLSG
jgi:RNA polymerase sigma-70 factor (ECF subfamily)